MNLYGVAFKALGSLGEPAQVVRRSAATNANGRVPSSPLVAKYHIWAQVTPVDPSTVEREIGFQFTRRTIEVNTDFALRGPSDSPDNLGDQVWWRGESYLVVNIRNYAKHGVGYVTALCEVETQDPHPPRPIPHTLAEEDAKQPA